MKNIRRILTHSLIIGITLLWFCPALNAEQNQKNCTNLQKKEQPADLLDSLINSSLDILLYPTQIAQKASDAVVPPPELNNTKKILIKEAEKTCVNLHDQLTHLMGSKNAVDNFLKNIDNADVLYSSINSIKQQQDSVEQEKNQALALIEALNPNNHQSIKKIAVGICSAGAGLLGWCAYNQFHTSYLAPQRRIALETTYKEIQNELRTISTKIEKVQTRIKQETSTEPINPELLDTLQEELKELHQTKKTLMEKKTAILQRLALSAETEHTVSDRLLQIALSLAAGGGTIASAHKTLLKTTALTNKEEEQKKELMASYQELSERAQQLQKKQIATMQQMKQEYGNLTEHAFLLASELQGKQEAIELLKIQNNPISDGLLQILPHIVI